MQLTKRIIKFIDENNDKILENNKKLLKENLADKMIECVNFSKRASNISKQDINKILGEKIC